MAQVTSEDFLGDMIVDITAGDPEQPPMHGGDHIVSAEPAGLEQVVEEWERPSARWMSWPAMWT